MIFRNDDVAFGSNVDQLREIQGIFEKHGIKEMYSVVPTGKNLYEEDPFSLGVEKLEERLGRDILTADKDVSKFVDESLKKGHSISLHGWKHTLIVSYPYEIQRTNIEIWKKTLEVSHSTKIKYFVPPFNNYNQSTVDSCSELSLALLAANPNQLEWAVRDNVDIDWSLPFCWYHYWRFYKNGLSPEKLDQWLKEFYDRANK